MCRRRYEQSSTLASATDSSQSSSLSSSPSVPTVSSHSVYTSEEEDWLGDEDGRWSFSEGYSTTDSALFATHTLWTSILLTPGVKLSRNTDMEDEYNNDGDDWREGFHEAARLESIKRQYRLEAKSPEMANVATRFLVDEQETLKRVSERRIHGFRGAADEVQWYSPCLYDNLAFRRLELPRRFFGHHVDFWVTTPTFE